MLTGDKIACPTRFLRISDFYHRLLEMVGGTSLLSIVVFFPLAVVAVLLVRRLGGGKALRHRRA